MENSAVKQVLECIHEIALRVRVLREWQAKHAARSPRLSEREVLIIELIKDYTPVTAKEIGNIFGLAPSSVNEIVRKLTVENLIEQYSSKTDSREKPLKLTKHGVEQLDEIKCTSAIRYEYLLKGFNDEQLKKFLPFLEIVSKTVDATIRHLVFPKY